MRRMLPAILMGLVLCGRIASSAEQTLDVNALVDWMNRPLALALLRDPDVHADLALTDAQKQEFAKIAMEQRTASTNQLRTFDPLQRDEASREKQTQAAREIIDTAWKASLAQLNESQRTRFTQIQLQRSGNRALDLPAVGSELHLTEDQIARIKAIKDAFEETGRKLTATPPATDEERANLRDESKRLNEKRDIDYKSVLTSEQVAAFEALKGKPFTFPEVMNLYAGLFATNIRLDIILVTQAAVQKELQFTEAQIQKVATLVAENDRTQGGRAQPDGATGFRDRIAQTRTYQDQLLKVLDEKQTKRLTELTIQKRGPSALGDPYVARQLKLTRNQLTRIQELRSESLERSKERSDAMQQALRDGDTKKFNQLNAEEAQRGKKADADSFLILTDEQKAAFEAMQGKKFDFPDPAKRVRPNRPGSGKPEST